MNGISLIVATLNRTDELARFVRSLNPPNGCLIDLILVDQNRDDRIEKLLTTLSLPASISVQHLRFTQNNQSLARNYGLARARHDLIAFPDDDCWYEPDTLMQVINLFQAQTQTAVIIGRWVEHTDAVPDRVTSVPIQAILNFRSVPTSAIVLFFRRTALPAANPFDARFGAYKEHGGYFGCGEETDLMMTIGRQGYSILFAPQVRIHHRYSLRRFGSLRQQFSFVRHRARGTGGLYAKHRSTRYVVVRGLVSPLLRSVRYLYNPSRCITETALCLGRLEGYFRWQVSHR